RQQRVEGHQAAGVDVDLAVIGGDEQGRTGGEDVQESRDEAVGVGDLGGEELVAQAVRVGDLVDPVAVGVHQRGAGGDAPPHVLHEGGRGAPAHEVAAAEVCAREAGAVELGAR